MTVRSKVLAAQSVAAGIYAFAELGNPGVGETWLVKSICVNSTVGETIDVVASPDSGVTLFPLWRVTLTANVPQRLDLWLVLATNDLLGFKTTVIGGTRRWWVSGSELAGVAP